MIRLTSPARICREACNSLAPTNRRRANMESICNFNCLRTLALLSLLVVFTAHGAAAAEVHGTVTNAQGDEPLGRIQVAIVGTSFIAATGPEGVFHISQVPPGTYMLQVSGVGYRTLTVPFQLEAADESKEFLLTLTPDNFRRTEVVEVRSDIFEAKDWPAVGDMTLTSSELQQTSTRSLPTTRSVRSRPSRVSPLRPTTIFSRNSLSWVRRTSKSVSTSTMSWFQISSTRSRTFPMRLLSAFLPATTLKSFASCRLPILSDTLTPVALHLPSGRAWAVKAILFSMDPSG